MSDRPPPTTTAPPEVSLLLRAHAEQHWLSREVVPVVRQIETRESLPEEQLGAALAYLEVAWNEAARRAGDTDEACTRLELSLPGPAPDLPSPASDSEAHPPELPSPASEAHPPELPSPDARAHSPGSWALAARARRYRAAVVVLREAVGRQVAPLLAAPPEGSDWGFFRVEASRSSRR